MDCRPAVVPSGTAAATYQQGSIGEIGLRAGLDRIAYGYV